MIIHGILLFLATFPSAPATLATIHIITKR
jgi:hypothetical protein